MKRALIGNGGHAREVMAQMGLGETEVVRFVDDEYWREEKGLLPLSEFDPNEYEVMIAVGDSMARRTVSRKMPAETKYFTFIHHTAMILDKECKIGEGSFIGANSIITTNVSIGKHSLLNRANHVGHDCMIADFFTMMPGSIVSGNVEIGECVYLGTNSSVREKTNICGQVTLGMNAALINDIRESGTYVGVPAKKLNNNE